MADPSFDVVSKIDRQEVDNALQPGGQGALPALRLPRHERLGRVVRRARHHDQGRHRGARQGRARGVQGEAGQALDLDEGARRRRAQAVGQELRHHRRRCARASTRDHARKIVKLIKDEGPKGVQAAIQDDQVRVTRQEEGRAAGRQALLQAAPTSTSRCSSPTTAERAGHARVSAGSGGRTGHLLEPGDARLHRRVGREQVATAPRALNGLAIIRWLVVGQPRRLAAAAGPRRRPRACAAPRPARAGRRTAARRTRRPGTRASG